MSRLALPAVMALVASSFLVLWVVASPLAAELCGTYAVTMFVLTTVNLLRRERAR